MLDASEMLIIDTRRFFQFLNKGQKQYQMEIRFCPIIVHYKSRISKYRTLINTRNYTESFNSGIKRLMIVKDMTKKIQEDLDDQIDVRKGRVRRVQTLLAGKQGALQYGKVQRFLNRDRRSLHGISETNNPRALVYIIFPEAL